MNENVAGELRAELARQSLTHDALGARMQRSGMWVGRRLRGLTPITLDDLERLCTALGVNPQDVIGRALSVL